MPSILTRVETTPLNRLRLCFVTAVPTTVTAFLSAHIERLADDYDVFVVSDFSRMHESPPLRATRIPLGIRRTVSPWRDATAMLNLFRIFRQHRFSIVHSVTPKAGLLSATASTVARVPIRIHWFTGQVWATRSGPERSILKAADKLVSRSCTHLLADSSSQRDFLVDEGVSSRDRISVIGDGSICGVDGSRFRPDTNLRRRIRQAHRIPEHAVVVVFLGRLNAEKGVMELAEAMRLLADRFSDLHCLLVGPDEARMEGRIRAVTAGLADRVHFQDHTAEPEAYLAAGDVFCMPSHREGFGMSVIEAAAAGLPAVATRIYGLTDAVADGETGLLVTPRDPVCLAKGVAELVSNPERRRRMGEFARQRTLEKFSQQRVTQGLSEFYANALCERKLARD